MPKKIDNIFGRFQISLDHTQKKNWSTNFSTKNICIWIFKIENKFSEIFLNIRHNLLWLCIFDRDNWFWCLGSVLFEVDWIKCDIKFDVIFCGRDCSFRVGGNFYLLWHLAWLLTNHVVIDLNESGNFLIEIPIDIPPRNNQPEIPSLTPPGFKFNGDQHNLKNKTC